MRVIIDKIISKIKLLYKRIKKESETEYTDLAPIDKIENGAEYLNALHWALHKKKVKNIALAGPYGSGKSSIIETYLNTHKPVDKKALRISMATFVESIVDDDGNPKRIDIAPNEIELGILKQLFYKVDYRKIPQSRYRKLHKVSPWRIFGYLLGLISITAFIMYVFFTETFNSIIDKITTAGTSIQLIADASFISPANLSLILFGIFILVVLAISAFIYRSILSRFRVKEIKLPVDATVKNDEESTETIFNKYMDEIIYFFEETKYKYVFYEDLDRLDDSKVFVHLRELNTLLNNYDAIRKRIVFIYAVKDDIFSDTDRTKFFEFIIPVIPIINSTNSGEILLKKLEDSEKLGIKHEITQGFVLDVSPYISDMRILLNTYNEFIVYKKTLREEQGLEKLLDEPMMALIIFKNLYPCDFADIQMEQGIIKSAFSDKKKHLKIKQDYIQGEIDKLTGLLDAIQTETLRSVKELKSAFLCEITGWRGFAYDIRQNGSSSSLRADSFMSTNFDVSQWENVRQCSGNYYTFSGNSNSYTCANFPEIYNSFLQRENGVSVLEGKRIAEVKSAIEKLKQELHDISGWSLKHLIEKFGSTEVLSEEVKQNSLLVFLLRRGYIDEKYANYINYFKGNTITKEDMNFILSVKNMECQPFNYDLTKTHMVAQRLQDYEFRQKPIYNFKLLEHMLCSDEHTEKLQTFLKQLSDEDEQSWKFVDEFVDVTEHRNRFIELLAAIWPTMWRFIANNTVLTYERKIHYLSLLITNVPIDILALMNIDDELSKFFEENEDILKKLASVNGSKVIELIENIQMTFSNVLVEDVPQNVCDYIFDNNCYALNPVMIQRIVEHKNKSLLPDLALKHYTTIIKLGYHPLIEYIRGNLAHYLETIVLTGDRAFDDEVNILDLLDRCIDNQELCRRIILHEEFILNDIEHCCKSQIDENKSAVNNVWNMLLESNKVFPTWENANSYFSIFKFLPNLITYIEAHVDEFKIANSQCVENDFIREFVKAEIDDKVFDSLLPQLRMDEFDIALNTLTEGKVSTMIGCRYFDFSVERFEEIKESHPDLCAGFILQNQEAYIENIDSIQMDDELFEALLFADELEAETAQALVDTFGTQHMTARIAHNLSALKITMNLQIFNTAWSHLDKSSKEKLMIENLDILDADALHSCFTDLESVYSDFIDRSRQKAVELDNTPENQSLAERLQLVEYITSHQLKEKKTFDPVTEKEIVESHISCRIKALK